VERTTLAPGLDVSRVLTGLWQIADMERDGRSLDLEKTADAMQPYVDAGITGFDMADHYGSAEDVAGLYRQRRGGAPGVRFFTKWVPKPGPATREAVRAAITRSLTRLRTERLDLLQFHAWTWADPSWLDAMFYLCDLRDEGLIAHLGFTNTDTAHLNLALATGLPIATNQVALSLLDGRAAGRMTDLCRATGVRLLAYGTIAGGWLSDRWLGRPEPDWERTGTWSQMKYGRFIRAAGGWDRYQSVLHAAARVAARHGVSIANVASRWVLEQPAVGAVIIGARLGERQHIDDTQRVFSFRLTDDDRQELETARAALSPIPGDCGDEYRTPPFLTASGDLSHHLESFPAPFAVHVEDDRARCFSGTVWEPMAGFSRAVRVGNRVLVSGTTATHGTRAIGGADPAAQAHFVIDKIDGSLRSLGARLQDVVRTRVYVRRASDWEAVARAHGERFGRVQPANTLVVADLIGDEYLVEMDAEAEITQTPGSGHLPSP
jgi:aryl-alcohol dehydrogenase-like predicted oxidoreductase/enamine deaminase RidA (YjgF/YER057c/UK114 family)